ncbi:MAG TPA: DUF6687 family protein [Planctomycetaceae bacterium]|nr:DUF6687 family protein [Planctomycetaceae bacterium]
MIDRFEIIDHGAPRPDAERILFCDGSGGELFRPETDLELSHWRPNFTPSEYRAGTSTEICYRFLDAPRPASWTVAINNHVDVDGILSVYALVQSEHALRHRTTIMEAAEIGDFWGWGESAAQRLFQGITFLMDRGGRPQEIYAEAFRRIPALVEGSDPEIPQIEESLEPLKRGIELVKQGAIARIPRTERFVQYIIAYSVAGDNDARAAYTPEFNQAISADALLWPQVRSCWDAERICLVSTERSRGWFHDLCFPGYLWADTERKWRVPGLNYHDGMASYDIRNDELIAGFQQLQRKETARGRWALGGTILPLSAELQKLFPVVGRFISESGAAAPSHLWPGQVAGEIERAFR